MQGGRQGSGLVEAEVQGLEECGGDSMEADLNVVVEESCGEWPALHVCCWHCQALGAAHCKCIRVAAPVMGFFLKLDNNNLMLSSDHHYLYGSIATAVRPVVACTTWLGYGRLPLCSLAPCPFASSAAAVAPSHSVATDCCCPAGAGAAGPPVRPDAAGGKGQAGRGQVLAARGKKLSVKQKLMKKLHFK